MVEVAKFVIAVLGHPPWSKNQGVGLAKAAIRGDLTSLISWTSLVCLSSVITAVIVIIVTVVAPNHVDETKHPVIQEVRAIYANNQVATRLDEPIRMQLAWGWGGSSLLVRSTG